MLPTEVGIALGIVAAPSMARRIVFFWLCGLICGVFTVVLTGRVFLHLLLWLQRGTALHFVS